MPRYLFRPAPAPSGARVRFDTASGSNTPADIRPVGYDGVSIPGSELRADDNGRLPNFIGPNNVQTLWQKTLDYRGTVTGTPVNLFAEAGGGQAPANEVSPYPRKAGQESITGNWDFLGGLTKDGVAVVTADDPRLPSGSDDTGYDAALLTYGPVFSLDVDGSGTARDRVTGGAVTKVGAPTLSTGPDGTPCLVFDGVDDYLEVADRAALSVATTGQITVVALMRPDVLDFPGAEPSSDGPLVHWLGKGTEYGADDGDQEWLMRMYNRTTDGSTVGPRANRISGYAFNPAGGLGAGSYFQEAVVAGDWIQVALVIDTINKGADGWGTTKIYKNGVLKDTDSLGAPYNIVSKDGPSPMRIGTVTLGSFFKGAIHKPTIYPAALTATQLAALNTAKGNTSTGLSTATPQKLGIPAPGATGQPSDAGHVHLRELPWVPADQGFKAAVCSPSLLTSASGLTAGVLFAIRLKLREAANLANVHYGISVAGSGLNAGECWAGLCNAAGVLLGKGPDQAATMAGTGFKTSALTAEAGQSLAVAAGQDVFVVLLANGTTPPQLYRAGSSLSMANANLTAGNYLFCTSGTGQTTLPASFNVAAAASVSSFWAAVS